MKNALILIPFLFIACSDNNFRKVEKLDGFRILAVKADVPEVAPGGSANLELYVSDPKGPAAGRTLNGTTVACIDPGIAVGAQVSCSHDPGRVAGTYAIDTTIPDLANNLFTGFTGTLNVTVPATILSGRTAREQSNGVGYIVIFTFNVDGREVSTFKRIMATNRGVLNANPGGSAMFLNGGAIAGLPQKGDHLSLSTSAAESYDYVNVDGITETVTETREVAWYVSEAEFDKPKAGIQEKVKLTKAPPAGPYLIVGIVRDDRGGVDVVRTTIP